MKRFISFSGGVESTTMCRLYGKGATALWCDTGAEHKAMYERIDAVEKKLKDIHPDFELIRLRGSVKHKGVEYDGLESLAIAYKFMPSGQKRYCTKYFKSQIIDEYLSDKGECELMIGFNADEEGRTGSLEMMPNVKYTYPLIEDGMTRTDCESYLKLNGFYPNFPVYMQRGGCRMCFFKTKKEYKAMYFLNQKEFWEVQEFEKAIQDNRTKFYSIMSSGQSLNQLAAECEMEKAFMKIQDWNDLYKSIKTDVACGAFCHR